MSLLSFLVGGLGCLGSLVMLEDARSAPEQFLWGGCVLVFGLIALVGTIVFAVQEHQHQAVWDAHLRRKEELERAAWEQVRRPPVQLVDPLDVQIQELQEQIAAERARIGRFQ